MKINKNKIIEDVVTLMSIFLPFTFLLIAFAISFDDEPKEGIVTKKKYIPETIEKVEKFKKLGKTGIWIIEDEKMPEFYMIDVKYNINEKEEITTIRLKKEEWEKIRIGNKYIFK